MDNSPNPVISNPLMDSPFKAMDNSPNPVTDSPFKAMDSPRRLCAQL